MSGLWPTGGLWRHPDFLRLWGAQIGSAFGSRITRTVLPMVAIGTLGASEAEVGILGALGVAPAILVGSWLGGTVERSHKRPILIGADLFRAVAVFSIPVAAWFGVLGMAQVYLVTIAIGAATTLFQITDNTLLPALIGRDHLLEGNSRLEATEGVAEAVGPGLGGLLAQILTAPLAMAVDGVSYLWSAALLSRIRVVEQPVVEDEPTVLSDLWIGLRASFTDPLVRPLLSTEALTCFFGGFWLALYMFVGLAVLDLSNLEAGMIVSAGGIGAFAGPWVAVRFGDRFGTGPAMVGCLAFGLAANLLIPLSLTAGWATIPILVVHQLLGDALLGAYGVHAMTLRQRVVPETVLGRVNATFHMTAGLMLTVGSLVAGLLGSTIGAPATLWIAAGGALLAVPVLAASSVSRLR